MILGFAHLTRSARRIDEAVAQAQMAGFELKSVARSVPSASAKWPLMTYRPTLHDLALMQGIVALEVISHETGSIEAPASLSLNAESGRIELRARDVRIECQFMSQAFPCSLSADEIDIRGAFPAWSARLKVVGDAGAPALPPLDVEGYSCLAFYSNSPEEDAQRFVALGARDATDQFAVTVNGRNLNIVMLRSPGGTILELVKVNRQ
jgi:hypothetical protein